MNDDYPHGFGQQPSPMEKALVFGIALALLVLYGFALAASPAAGQTSTIRSDVTTDLPDNTTGEISPMDLRGILLAMLDEIDAAPTTATVDTRIATWARAVGAIGTIPDAVLPLWLRQANLAIPATWARSIPAPTGRAPLSALPPQLSRIPAADCADGQVWIRGASTWGCGTPAGGGGGLSAAQVRLEIAPFARATAAGVADPPRLAGSPAAHEFLTVGSSGAATDWRPISESDIPSAIARDSELPASNELITMAQRTTLGRFPTFACPAGQVLKSGGATYSCQVDADTQRSAAYIDGRIATFALRTGATGTAPRDRLGGAPAGGFNTGSNRYFLATGSGVNVGNVEWVNTIPRSELEVSLVSDVSSFGMSMSRRDISAAAQQVTIAAAGIDPQHALTVSGGCIVVGSGGGGVYQYSASIRGTPNLVDDGDPTDSAGPQRIWPTFYIRRTRGSTNTDLALTRNTHYYRGYTNVQSPASYWSRFGGMMIAAAGDTYCVMVDATAAGAHQADFLTLSDGEVVVVSQRIG